MKTKVTMKCSKHNNYSYLCYITCAFDLPEFEIELYKEEIEYLENDRPYIYLDAFRVEKEKESV